MDFTQISDLELHEELWRRRDVLENDKKGLSVIPLEFLISEYEKRKANPNSEMNIQLKELESWKPEVEEYDILFNAIKTPDGTILSSKHRHDYVAYEDTKTGKVYAVDGGADYFRSIGDMSDCEDLSITSLTPFSDIRERFHWGSRGVNNDEPIKMLRLSNLTNIHIEAIIKNVFKGRKNSTFKKWFEEELKFRKENKICIQS
jgi:hypothetical protein